MELLDGEMEYTLYPKIAVINNDIILMVLNRSLYHYEHRDR